MSFQLIFDPFFKFHRTTPPGVMKQNANKNKFPNQMILILVL